MTTWSLCTMLNELDVLEIRLGTLDQVVDRHVIAESSLTYSGDQKPFNLLENKFRLAPWCEKIRPVIVEDSPQEVDEILPGKLFWPTKNLAWQRENHQRDALRRGCWDMGFDDLVYLSDLDEIVRPEIFTVARKYLDSNPNHILGVKLPQYVMKLNCRWKVRSTTAIARFCKGETLLRRGPQDVRLAFSDMEYEDLGGWHLSYMGGAEMIRYKIQHAAHRELDRPEFTDLSKIKHRIDRLQDMFDRNKGTHTVMDSKMPQYVLQNRERFEHLIA